MGHGGEPESYCGYGNIIDKNSGIHGAKVPEGNTETDFINSASFG